MNADRNLFAHFLITSKSRDINLRDLLKYELSPVPCALAHTDGSLRKNTKSCLLSVLEECVQALPRLPTINSDEPSTAYVLDGMAAVQMLKTAGARTFKEMGSSYFDGITAPLGKNNCVRVDVVFDRYDKADSIKEGERVRRGAIVGFEVEISGPNTPVPKNWKSFISNPVNKINLQHFLSTMWTEKGKLRLKPGQQLVLAGCFPNPEDVRLVVRGNACSLNSLKCDHEEADTRMMLHASNCSYQHPRVVVQSPDTDVAVLCVHTYESMRCEELWFKTGVKDKLRFVPVHTLTEVLGTNLCNLLPAFHALTGCDTTSALYQIGKRKGWKVLKDHAERYANMSHLGSE